MSASKWNKTLMFPTDSNFIVRCIGANFGPSKSSGNPMVTLSWEIVSPQQVEIGDGQYVIAGIKCGDTYYTTSNPKDLTKQENARKRFEEFCTKLGIDPATINWDNVDTKPFLGKLVFVMISPDVEERRKNPTAAQLAANPKAEGDVMRNPINGQPLVDYYPKIREVFGLAPSDGVTLPY